MGGGREVKEGQEFKEEEGSQKDSQKGSEDGSLTVYTGGKEYTGHAGGSCRHEDHAEDECPNSKRKQECPHEDHEPEECPNPDGITVPDEDLNTEEREQQKEAEKEEKKKKRAERWDKVRFKLLLTLLFFVHFMILLMILYFIDV